MQSWSSYTQPPLERYSPMALPYRALPLQPLDASSWSTGSAPYATGADHAESQEFSHNIVRSPASDGTAQSLRMSISELLAVENTLRPFSAPASMKVDLPSLDESDMMQIDAHQPESTSQLDEIPGYKSAAAAVETGRCGQDSEKQPQYYQPSQPMVIDLNERDYTEALIGYQEIPAREWRAIDRLADLVMNPDEAIEEHIDRFCDVLEAQPQALSHFPIHLFAYFFLRSLSMHHDGLRKAGEHYLKSIDLEATLGKLFAHLCSVYKTMQMMRDINEQDRRDEQRGPNFASKSSRLPRGPPRWSSISNSVSHPSSPESDIRTRITSSWDSISPQQENPRAQRGNPTPQAMKISFDQPIHYANARPFECEIKLPPIINAQEDREDDFSNVEMDAVKIMMQLGRK